MMDLKVSKKTADGLIERTSSMLDKIESKTVQALIEEKEVRH